MVIKELNKLKSKLRGILSIVAISTVIAGTVVASDFTQTIDAMINSVKVRVNHRYISGENIVYKGTTYVPLRVAAEVLEKEVGWDHKTNTVTINDSLIDSFGVTLKVPEDIPSSASLIETVAKYRYHKYDYKVKLPNGGYITNIAVSDAPGLTPYVSIAGHGNDNEPFLAGRNRTGDINFFYTEPNMMIGNDSDVETLHKEMDKFFNIYGY